MNRAFFSLISEAERIELFSRLGPQPGSITIWIKSKKNRYVSSLVKVHTNEIVIQGHDLDISGPVLFYIDFSEAKYFSSGELVQMNDFSFSIQSLGRFYRLEFRKSYRLLTVNLGYFCTLDFPFQEHSREGVDGIRTVSLVDIYFREFLQMIIGEDAKAMQRSRFVVYDLSVSGLSLFVPINFDKSIEIGFVLSNLILRWKRGEMALPAAKIVNIANHSSGHLKIGLVFLGEDEVFQKMVTRMINEECGKINESKLFEEN